MEALNEGEELNFVNTAEMKNEDIRELVAKRCQLQVEDLEEFPMTAIIQILDDMNMHVANCAKRELEFQM